MTEIEFIDSTASRVKQVARRYQRCLPEIDIAQELTLALLLLHRENPDLPAEDLIPLANTRIKLTVTDLFRTHRGRGKIRQRPKMIAWEQMDSCYGSFPDPVESAIASEIVDDLRAVGFNERVVISALIDPPAGLRALVAGKNSQIPVSLHDIADFYGIGIRGVRKAVDRIRQRFQEAR